MKIKLQLPSGGFSKKEIKQAMDKYNNIPPNSQSADSYLLVLLLLKRNVYIYDIYYFYLFIYLLFFSKSASINEQYKRPMGHSGVDAVHKRCRSIMQNQLKILASICFKILYRIRKEKKSASLVQCPLKFCIKKVSFFLCKLYRMILSLKQHLETQLCSKSNWGFYYR